jgi:hypothetical protein
MTIITTIKAYLHKCSTNSTYVNENIMNIIPPFSGGHGLVYPTLFIQYLPVISSRLGRNIVGITIRIVVAEKR